jgi:GTPase SAR1 family protein
VQSGEFSDSLDSTKVAEPFIKEINVSGKPVRSEIWDTVGLDKHRVTTPSAPIYRRVDGCFLAFDLTSKESFSHIENWLKEVNTRDNQNRTIYILIGTKLDLADSARAVTQDEALALVKTLNLGA